MSDDRDALRWIEGQHERMCAVLEALANINSGSHNLAGMSECGRIVSEELQRLGATVRHVAIPEQVAVDSRGESVRRELGRVIQAVKRERAARRMLLGIHLDTVYPAEHPFQRTWREGGRLRGPGVADAKGGLVVMLAALEALERSGLAEGLGWEVVINPDEELGSPGSAGFLAEAARRNQIGLLFEPTHEDGAMVSSRKGSGNYTVVVRGRSAHAGKNPEDGRNAIHALAHFITDVSSFNRSDVTVNFGKIEGGGPANVVPDLAIARFNVRVADRAQQEAIEKSLAQAAASLGQRHGVGVELHGAITAPPKPVEGPMQRLIDLVSKCGNELGLQMTWRPSGGISDGNRLAAAGLTNVDSLGVRGGRIHSDEEYMLLESLVERARLSALVMMKLARGQTGWPLVAGANGESLDNPGANP